METLHTCLASTISPDVAVRKEAEAYLKSMETSQGYGKLLMVAMDNGAWEMPVRLSAAITFKNYLKHHWDSDTGNQDISEHDRVEIKSQIIDLMLRLPENLQKQVSDGISIIGKHDFPSKWTELFPKMSSTFTSNDFHAINGVLRTANPLFKRYRFEDKSDKLWTEIKIVLEQFAEPLTTLFSNSLTSLQTHRDQPAIAKILLDSLLLMCKIFYSLNFQDLPEQFEDRMEIWMKGFHNLLEFPFSPALDNADPEKPGVLQELKAQICENVALYAQKYDEEFTSCLPTFFQDIWTLLVTITPEPKFDLLVSAGMKFLSSAAQREHYKHLFATKEVLTNICEKIVAPNVFLRGPDVEMFENEPEEYIRRDIEGSDVDTRRHGACELVKALCVFSEQEVTALFGSYVQTLLQQYASNPTANWFSKDAAIFLVTSLAVRGATREQGTTKVSSLINVSDFFTQNIVGDLQGADVNSTVQLRADAIKYVMTFRNQLSREMHLALLPLLAAHISSSSVVVSTYAAACIERLLTLRNGATTVITEADLAPLTPTLFQNLFAKFSGHGAEDNEYIMKCIMRALACTKSSAVPFTPIIMTQLNNKLVQVAKNPSLPHFNHYLFESICCTIKNVEQDVVTLDNIEDLLLPTFTPILQDNIDFQPYVFQVLSQLIEARPSPVPEKYLGLFPVLLTPTLWQSIANAPPLVRLLNAIIVKQGGSLFADRKQLEGVLGIFQRLVSSKTTDKEGFTLVEALVHVLSLQELQTYLGSIFNVLCTRMSKMKTPKFVKGFLVFISWLVGKHGGSTIIKIVDGVQPGLFAMILNRLLEDTKIANKIDKKICVVGLTALLTTPEVINGALAALWPRIAAAVAGVCEDVDVNKSVEDGTALLLPQVGEEGEEIGGYKASYARLVNSGSFEIDPFPSVVDVRAHVATTLSQASHQRPGVFPGLVSHNEQPIVNLFHQYFQHAGATLV